MSKKKGKENSETPIVNRPAVCQRTAGAEPAVTMTCEARASSVNPVTYLKQVMATGKIDEDKKKENKRILDEFLKGLLPVMKANDKEFARLFQKIYYTGSHYENLRISDPNEFDINLILKLPFQPPEREIVSVGNVKSFVKYKVKTEKQFTSLLWQREELLNKLFEGEYLSPSKVRSWIQGIVDRCINCFTKPRGVKTIAAKASGPAKTMVIETVYGYDIDVDLVPVIQFTHPEWPEGARRDMIRTFQVKPEDQFWFMVPKEFPSGEKNVNPIDSKRLWRVHFPEIEKKIIKDKGCIKPVIKLLKALRDNNKWHILASYYLKTIVLWMAEKHSSLQDYWKEDYMYDRLTEALEALKESVSKRMIKYYFYPDFNLIQKINDSQADNVCNRLERIIKEIKTNPEKIEFYFKMK